MIITAKMSHWQLTDTVETLAKSMRSISHKVDLAQFKRLWNASTEEQREEVIDYILLGEKESVKEWMETHPAIKAEDWGYTRLRDRAKKLGIRNYSRLTRESLIKEIMKKESTYDKERDARGPSEEAGGV
jgi:hypothetical protein